MMTTVLLYGGLRKQFGKRWMLDIDTPAEAIRAIDANVGGRLRQYLIDHSEPGFHLLVGDRSVGGVEEVAMHTGGQTLKIIPAVAGAKDAIWTVIIGVALVWATAGWGFAEGSFGAMAMSAGSAIGVSLVLGGLAQMLFKPPTQGLVDPTGDPSYAFTGPVNTSAQGHPVPICYGKLRVGSAVISASFHTADYADTVSGSGDGRVTITTPYSITWTGSKTIQATGGSTPYSWAFATDALGALMNSGGTFSINSSTGSITGSPASGLYYVTVNCFDAGYVQATADFEINVGGQPATASTQGLNPQIQKVK